MNAMSLSFVLMLLCAAVYIDLRWHRIPNWLVIVLLALGIFTQVLASGTSGLFSAAAGMAVGMICMLPFYNANSMGAGDVKLMGALGALLGPAQTLQAVAATLIAGGLLALLVVLSSKHAGLFFSRYARMAKTLFTTGRLIYLPRSADDPASRRFAYAAAIAAGTTIVLYRNHAFTAMVLP